MLLQSLYTLLLFLRLKLPPERLSEGVTDAVRKRKERGRESRGHGERVKEKRAEDEEAERRGE